MNLKVANRCIDRLSDVKERSIYFKVRKVRASDVMDNCLYAVKR